MLTGTNQESAAILTRFLEQPARLPAGLRAGIEAEWEGLPVQLYALADLDASMRLVQTWVALGPRHVAWAQEQTGASGEALRSFERTADGQLAAVQDGLRTPVRVCRCFPWLEPQSFISLRDEKENEVALLTDLGTLDPESRTLVEAALAEAGFVLEIERIESSEEIFEIRHWVVQTRQGPRAFQTPHDTWPRKIARGGYLIRDVAGDLYRIARPEALDAKSQKILRALVD